MYWQFLTYMFVHSNWSHLFSNMLGLLIFGISVERSIGSKEFLLFYFLTGILCGVFSFFFHYFTGEQGGKSRLFRTVHQLPEQLLRGLMVDDAVPLEVGALAAQAHAGDEF